MKIKLEVRLCTDGDFHVRPEVLYDFQKCFYCDDDTDYIKCIFDGLNISKDFSQDEWIKLQVKDCLQIILTSIKVSYTHYNILLQLYELFDKAICALDDMEIGSVYKGTMSGNYEGTKIKISIVE